MTWINIQRNVSIIIEWKNRGWRATKHTLWTFNVRKKGFKQQAKQTTLNATDYKQRNQTAWSSRAWQKRSFRSVSASVLLDQAYSKRWHQGFSTWKPGKEYTECRNSEARMLHLMAWREIGNATNLVEIGGWEEDGSNSNQKLSLLNLTTPSSWLMLPFWHSWYEHCWLNRFEGYQLPNMKE